ncbi:MAG: FAD-dependent oxidoreductase [Chloroflexi bacterium]|nr:FAD-dependent oxidoreductase [Chloroflexota bacterium]
MTATLTTRTMDADVLVIGGGIAGCMAAIRARESGLDVILAEKTNTNRSGNAATGVDHILTYVPQIHGSQVTPEELVQDHAEAGARFMDQELALFIITHSYERILDLERFGVEMRDPQGNFRLVKKVHRVPAFLHFAGRDMKVRLTEEALRRKVNIMNRVMITDLLANDDGVYGAIGVSTREPEMHVFRAKAVVVSTGGVARLYRPTSGMPLSRGRPGSETGDLHSAAFRVGAELLNMEFTVSHTGPRYFQRCGRGSYTPGGRVYNALGQPMGADAKLQRNAIDKSVESGVMYLRELEKGTGPVYMDCSGCSEEDIKYIRWALSNEGNCAFLDYLDNEGIDLRTHRIEFGMYEPRLGQGNSGIAINTRCETPVPGLFAAGDAIGGVMRASAAGALALGWQSGESAATYAMASQRQRLPDPDASTVGDKLDLCNSILTREFGTTWQDAQTAINVTMDNYVGRTRSETLIKAGLARLKMIRTRALRDLKAENQHELMRSLEVLSLMDVGELVAMAALERKESRFLPTHYRADYPEQDPNWFKFLVVRKSESGIDVYSKAIPQLQPESL